MNGPTANANVAQSYDPNEMAGPAGVGAQRYVKPGEPLDYTIYFENQTNATAAAIKIAVTLPKDANLDWSTLELGEVVFGDHTDTGFVDDKTARSIKYAFADSGCEVRTAVTETDSDVTWNLRIWDPTTADHFPDDFNKGVLPPNDPETHCGEGHITYRVKVKEDALPGQVIHASASIVFDDNPAIETDPAWWNTVVSLGVAFVEREIEANEGETATIRVNGGSTDSASSVKVYLTYNTAAAADVDLAKGTVRRVEDAAPYQTNLKFPLTLTWAKGEIGEKVITIPVKTDKTVEGDEFFTLQLAEAEGMELGEERVCTVTIRDTTVAAGKETLQDAVNNAIVKMSTSGKGKWAYAAVGTGGEAGPGRTASASAVSPAIKKGETSELKAGAVKGSGTLTFDVRVANDALEGESPEVAEGASKTVLTLLDGKTELLAWTNETDWTSASYTVKEEKATSHAFTWRVVQGADTNAHAYVANVVWSPAGTDMRALTLTAETYANGEACDDPSAGGTVSGGGVYPDKTKISLAATAKVGYEFVGWARGGGRGATALPEILSNKAKWQVVVMNDAEYVAVFEKIPYVRGLADPADGGKVSGSGLCAAGKKVTLKATANKGFVFVGWVDAQIAIDGDRLLLNAVEYIATTPTLVIDRGAKPTKDSATSTTITNVTGDATYYACFITSEDDKASIELEVNGEEMRLAGDGSPHQTNIWAGVYLEWPVAASALSATTVKVAGLPTGLKFADKPVTSKIGTGKAAVTVTNVPANTIYGAPTAASKVGKDGNPTPSAVKLTVTTAGKSSQTYQIDATVDALPTWAVGTFDGATAYCSESGSDQEGDGGHGVTALPSGLATVTIDAKGKISGKLLEGGLTWTLSAPYFSDVESPASDVDGAEPSPVFYATVIGKSGKVEITNEVTVAMEEVAGARDARPYQRGVVNGGTPVGSVEWAAWQNLWKAEPWKALGKDFDKKVQVYVVRADGSFIDGDEAVTAVLGAEVTGRVTLKFAANGTAKAEGEFATYDKTKEKYTTVKATGSATLVPVDEDGCEVFIYLTPKGMSPHARCLDVLWPKE